MAFSVAVEARLAHSFTTMPRASPRVNVLIDETHAKYSDGYFYPNTVYMRSVLSPQGYSFDRTKALNSTVLAPYDVLVTDLYGENHTRSEIGAIKDWVNGGGRLILIGEWSDVWVPWQNNVSSAFEVWFKNWTVYDDVAKHNGDNRYIEISSFARHPLVRDIDKVVLGSAGFIDMNRSRGIAVVAWSSVSSYVNAGREDWKKSGPWPVIGCKPYGSGRISMISDVDLWTNRFVNSTSGQIQLFRNMAEPWLYEIIPKVVDSKGSPLSDAHVTARCPNGTTLSVRTNSTGRFTLKGLEEGSYVITVSWRGVQVNQTSVTVGVLEGDAGPTIKTGVYYLTVVVTSGIFGGRVPGALVEVYSINRTRLESGMTDTSGSIEFKQVPQGSWTVEVRAQYLSTSTAVTVDSDQSVEIRVPLTSEILAVALPMIVVIVGVWLHLIFRAKKPAEAQEHEKP